MMDKRSLKYLAVCVGLIYLFFGLLKFFPGLSPAEEIASKTIESLTFGILGGRWSLILLAGWESLLGSMLIFGLWQRISIPLALVHLILTFSPLFLFPEEVFNGDPLHPTLLGQYIVKNIVIIGVLLVLWKEGRRAYRPVAGELVERPDHDMGPVRSRIH